MARSNQRALSKEQSKIRVLAVAKMLNEGRLLSASEIQRRLDLQYGIQVDRKTIYTDIYAINRFIPIAVMAGRNGGYCRCDVLGGCKHG